jgi:hypothetical protein
MKIGTGGGVTRASGDSRPLVELYRGAARRAIDAEQCATTRPRAIFSLPSADGSLRASTPPTLRTPRRYSGNWATYKQESRLNVAYMVLEHAMRTFVVRLLLVARSRLESRVRVLPENSLF